MTQPDPTCRGCRGDDAKFSGVVAFCPIHGWVDPSAPITVTIPARFYLDHVGRGFAAGTVARQTAKEVTVALSWRDMMNLWRDASEYAYGLHYAYALRRSATATLRRLVVSDAAVLLDAPALGQVRRFVGAVPRARGALENIG